MIELTPLDTHVVQGLVDMYESFDVFVVLQVLAMTGFGSAWSGSMAIGAFAGYLTFAFIAVETGAQPYENLLYVTLTLILFAFAFKAYRMEGPSEA